MTPAGPTTVGRTRFRLSPESYARITVWAVWLIGLIVVTGGAVRLTGSGLGCTDWPTCQDNQIYPEWQFHGWVEFGNRLITGLVSIVVVVAVLGSLARLPRRRDLTWLSWGLVVGVIGQIVLGGIVVLSHLWPPFVMGHFILSQLLVLDAVALWHRARIGDDERTEAWPSLIVQRLAKLLAGVVAIAIVTGTVVTGTGPHSGSHGDELVERLPFSIDAVTRLHGIVDFTVIVTITALAVALRRSGAPRELLGRVELVLVFGILQAAIGYTQFLTGVPPLLVTLHILGATLVWGSVVWLLLGLFQYRPARANSRHDDVAEPSNDVPGRDRSGRDLVAGG